MLLGTLRRGSGMTGFGGVCVAPVVEGPALIAPPTRPFGAGFGTGTACAKEVALAARIDCASTCAPATRVGCAADRVLGFPVNASSCVARRPFTVILGKSRFRFCVKVSIRDEPKAIDFQG